MNFLLLCDFSKLIFVKTIIKLILIESATKQLSIVEINQTDEKYFYINKLSLCRKEQDCSCLVGSIIE